MADATVARLTAPHDRPDGTALAWSAYLAGLVLASVLWALAGPLFSVPDEPAHYLKAAAVARGQLGGTPVTEGGTDMLAVEVPERFTSAQSLPACFAFRNDVTADCALTDYEGDTTTVLVATPAGSYPPAFYALTGWPTLISQGPNGLYGGRVVAGVATAVLVTGAAVALSSLLGRRLAMAAGLLTATPMVLYLGASLNPNGFEIAAAIATWSFALVALRRAAAGLAVPRWMCAGVVVAGAALALTRWLSPVYLVGIVGLVGLSVPLGRLRSVVTDRRLQLTAGALGGALVVAGASIATTENRTLLPGAPVPEGDSAVQVLVGATDAYLSGFVGVFGWLDTPTPVAIEYIWFGLVAALVGVVAVLGRGPVLRALLLTALATFLFPIVSQLPSVEDLGTPWQGRYTLPLAVGVPVLAFAGVVDLAALRPAIRRIAGLVGWLCAAGHVVAFYWVLRRYATGYRGALDVVNEARWHAPLGNGWMLVGFTVAMVVVAALTTSSTGHDRGPAASAVDVERRSPTRPTPAPV